MISCSSLPAARRTASRAARFAPEITSTIHEFVSEFPSKRGFSGWHYLVVHYRNGLAAPSWLVSDGTLRFLALTLLAYIPNPTGPYLVEEPENGIHPGAVETVLESLSSVYEAQILLATHSPIVARLAKVEQMLCFARNDKNGVDVVAGPAHPRLGHWPGVVDLGMLLESGVLG